MASIRRLKKDIDFVCEEIIIECFMYNYIFPEKNEDVLTNIISDTIKMKNELKTQINAVKRAKDAPNKSFGAIRKNMETNVASLVKRLDSLDQE